MAESFEGRGSAMAGLMHKHNTMDVTDRDPRFQNRDLSLSQGRGDGVSRVSNAYGPTAEGGPPKDKIHTRYF
jgi:hypothetical protein